MLRARKINSLPTVMICSAWLVSSMLRKAALIVCAILRIMDMGWDCIQIPLLRACMLPDVLCLDYYFGPLGSFI
jgi:hypothetical protein